MRPGHAITRHVTPPGGERATHLRLLAAYGALKNKDVAAVLDVHPRTVSRMRAGGASITRDQLDEIAAKVDAPVWLRDYGARPATDAALLSRIEALEREMREHRR
jgi:hypothetical protein